MFGERLIRSGTRALMGPMMCLIPETLLLRAETIEMNDMSLLVNGRCFCVSKLAMVRAQAASTQISRLVPCVQDSR